MDKKIHYDLVHRSFHYVKYKILQDKYYYKGIYNNLKNVINKYEICYMKNGNVIKREPTSEIICKYTKQRYFGDLTNIPYEFIIIDDFRN